VLAVRSGELALSLNRRFVIGERFVGTLAIALWAAARRVRSTRTSRKPTGQKRREYGGGSLDRDGLTEERHRVSCRPHPAQTNHSIRFLRVSPDGQRVAFVEEALARGTGGHVAVVDVNGNVTELTREWDSVRGLAWTLVGDEIWFAAGAARSNRALRAVNLAHRERVVLDAPGSLTLWDIAADGRVLLSRDDERRAVVAAGPGATVERDLSWFDDTGLAAISDDGKRILGGDRPGAFLRPTTGRPRPFCS